MLVNCSIEQSAQTILSRTTIFQSFELVFKSLVLKPEDAEQKETLSRVINMLGKLMKTVDGSQRILHSKDIIIRVLFYFTMDDPEYSKNALITLHAACKMPEFREVCFNQHKFTMQSFDPYVEKANSKFMKAYETQAWEDYVNICASITAFSGVFPERKSDFKNVIVPLIKVMGDKLDKVRKNSAVLLAKLVEENEENRKIMTDNHGTEILMSVQQSLFR